MVSDDRWTCGQKQMYKRREKDSKLTDRQTHRYNKRQYTARNTEIKEDKPPC